MLLKKTVKNGMDAILGAIAARRTCPSRFKRLRQDAGCAVHVWYEYVNRSI